MGAGLYNNECVLSIHKAAYKSFPIQDHVDMQCGYFTAIPLECLHTTSFLYKPCT